MSEQRQKEGEKAIWNSGGGALKSNLSFPEMQRALRPPRGWGRGKHRPCKVSEKV